jgi:hypothetical protein
MKTTTGALETIVVSSAEILEDLTKLRYQILERASGDRIGAKRRLVDG